VRHDPSHELAHVVEVHEHAAVFITVLCCPLVVVRVSTAGVMVAKVQQQSQQKSRHHRLRDAHQVRRNRTFVGAVIDAMIAAEAFGLHDRCVAAVASAAGLREEHVEVMILVIAAFKAITADGHAWRCSTRSTAIGDNVGHPNETALCVIIIATNCKQKNHRQ
jgi:hypothetical protein